MLFVALLLWDMALSWAEAVYAKPPASYDWYAPLPEPPEYLSNKVLEPDDTPEVANEYVRARSRR